MQQEGGNAADGDKDNDEKGVKNAKVCNVITIYLFCSTGYSVFTYVNEYGSVTIHYFHNILFWVSIPSKELLLQDPAILILGKQRRR